MGALAAGRVILARGGCSLLVRRALVHGGCPFATLATCTILLGVTLPVVLLTMLSLLMVMLLLVSMQLPPLLLVASRGICHPCRLAAGKAVVSD